MAIAVPHSILLDAEALSALADGEHRIQVWAAVARRTDSTLFASTLTLVEAARGGSRDARVRLALKALTLVPVTESIGFDAGRLRAAVASGRRTARDLSVDAVVAATALSLAHPVVVLTSDADDLKLLLAGTAVRVERL